MQNPLLNLYEAEKTIKSLERLMYLTYPILQEKAIAFKCLKDLKKIIRLFIISVLEIESRLKILKLSNNPNKNLQNFLLICIPKYDLSLEEKHTIIEILKLNKKYQESVMEFKRRQDIIIMSNQMEYQIINEKKLKDFIKITKNILVKITKKIRKV
jgi:hypothetical protein